MRIISIDAIRGGEILAESLMNEQRNVLIPAGTVLKKDYVPLIETFHIESLKIEDPYQSYEQPNPIINRNRLEVLVNWVKNLMERHIYHGSNCSLKEFEVIANEIVREVNKISEDTVIDMEERTADLYEHTVMVTLLSTMVAKKLHLDEKKQFNIAIGSLFHDIGIRYITVPYENCDMSKGDQINIFEYKKHTILGYSALDDQTWIPNIAKKMVLTHHEKSDGTGFPMHQRVKEIECKILQACDVFDCLISGMECNRTSVQYALEYIMQESGKMYEESIVNSLVSMIAKYPVGTTVKTNKEEQGVVISQTTDPIKPIIMIIDTDEDKIKEDRKHNLMLEEHISILKVV